MSSNGMSESPPADRAEMRDVLRFNNEVIRRNEPAFRDMTTALRDLQEQTRLVVEQSRTSVEETRARTRAIFAHIDRLQGGGTAPAT